MTHCKEKDGYIQEKSTVLYTKRLDAELTLVKL